LSREKGQGKKKGRKKKKVTEYLQLIWKKKRIVFENSEVYFLLHLLKRNFHCLEDVACLKKKKKI
jgi:hypothetical protein